MKKVKFAGFVFCLFLFSRKKKLSRKLTAQLEIYVFREIRIGFLFKQGWFNFCLYCAKNGNLCKLFDFSVTVERDVRNKKKNDIFTL